MAVDGNLGDDALKIIDFRPLSGNYIEYQRERIRELRETSGNTETSTGNIAQGVTAASAIAALQEASGKGSRDSTRGSYRAFAQVVSLVIELIRQFYGAPRRFRILGRSGAQDFVSYSNAGLQPQSLGIPGEEALARVPEFDVEVKAQKASSYTRLSQNELALQFYHLGFFDPAQAEQALLCLGMMDFDGREELIEKLGRLGSERERLLAFRELALALAGKYEPELAAGLAASIPSGSGPRSVRSASAAPRLGGEKSKEGAQVRLARSHALAASQPEAAR